MLPTDENGNPDYKYMGQYMHHIEQKKILNYLSYLEQKETI